MRTDPLDLEMRRRIFALVQEFPGLHIREVARQLDTSLALVEYHASILRENSLVREERDDRYVRLFAVPDDGSGPTESQRQVLRLLRERLPLRITLHLLDHDEAQQHKAVSEALGLGKSKLSFHLRKLEAARIVRKTSDGRFEPVDRPRLLRVILQFPPTTDLRAEFADVWLSLYGEK
jgi:predicted transcriptional regulator